MEKIALAQRALDSLESILTEPFSVIVRDATIQRFEYSSEAVWKALLYNGHCNNSTTTHATPSLEYRRQ